jgi:hypothetical protein
MTTSRHRCTMGLLAEEPNGSSRCLLAVHGPDLNCLHSPPLQRSAGQWWRTKDARHEQWEERERSSHVSLRSPPEEKSTPAVQGDRGKPGREPLKHAMSPSSDRPSVDRANGELLHGPTVRGGAVGVVVVSGTVAGAWAAPTCGRTRRCSRPLTRRPWTRGGRLDQCIGMIDSS